MQLPSCQVRGNLVIGFGAFVRCRECAAAVGSGDALQRQRRKLGLCGNVAGVCRAFQPMACFSLIRRDPEASQVT